MGGISSISCKLWKKRDVRILFIGLDAAGKTTILYQLKLGEVVVTIPTIGFNVETIDHGSINFTAWDVGLRSGSRPLLRHYYPNTEALVFVIDCNDRMRYDEALDELQETLKDYILRDIPILILANKQDLVGVMSVTDIRSDLMMKNYLIGRKWEVFPVCALKGDGLTEGLDWLTAVVTNTMPANQNEEKDKQQTNIPSEANISESYMTKVISYMKKLFV